jgi:phosphatidate cytidylyltransferase
MKRVATALILLPIFGYLILWSPDWAFWTAVAAVAVLCFREFAALVALHEIQPPGLFGYAAGLLALFLPHKDLGFLVIAALLAMILALRSYEMNEALPYAGALVLGVVYIFGSFRGAIDLGSMSRYWVFFAFSLNWVGDVAAFYVGRAMGKHKLAPRISPGKSWEGAMASVAASVLYAAIYFPRLLPAVPLPEALAIAAAGNIAGQFGDLCESALKRGAGVKDSGAFLPGHGGWLDRLDSSLFALPVVYLLADSLHR